MTEANPHELYSDHESGERVPSVEMLAARETALELLEAVTGHRQELKLAMDNSRPFRTLPSRDRAFTRMLVSTTLRRLGQIDDLIERAQEKPETLSSNTLRNILRLGVCQIMFMKVPDHAAVDTAVRLAEANGMHKQKGFVNGLLRTMTRIGKEWESKQDPARLNTPEWLLKLWIEDYGLRTAAEISSANLSEAPLDITVRDEDSKAYWGNALKAAELSTGTLRRVDGGMVQEMEGYENGKWWVQDAAAAIPATLFGPLEEGTHVIDLCAAPGGKTMQLAAKGAFVTALDRSAQRMKRLEQNLARMKLQSGVRPIVADAAEWRPPHGEEAPQRILLDAPCSATGTIRRHPDVKYLKSPRDMERLLGVQERILTNAADMLGVGGVLIYCVCSLQKAEGERQVEKFLSQHPDFSRVPIRAEEVGGYADLVDENGDLRVLPFHLAAHGGMDGFYVSRLTKLQ